MTEKLLTDRECLKILLEKEKTFGETITLADGTTRPNKLAGEKYWLFSYKGKAFISQKPMFVEAVKKGDLSEVELAINEDEQLSVASFITWTQENNLKNKKVENESITVESFRKTAVNQYEALD